MGPVRSLPILAGHNQSVEATIAAWGDHIVVAGINLNLSNPIDYNNSTLSDQHVATWVSHDRGVTWSGANKTGVGQEARSDPVVRVAGDGTFWVIALGAIYRSGAFGNYGDTWTTVAPSIGFGDKPWMALDPRTGAMYVAGRRGYWKFSADGSQVSTVPGLYPQMAAAYVDKLGIAHFLGGLVNQHTIQRWDGTSANPPVQEEGPVLQCGSISFCPSVSMGETSEGTQWIVRAQRLAVSSPSRILVNTRKPPDSLGAETFVTQAGEMSFLPAAALDSSGRLHVIWYESSGQSSTLKYSRSKSTDFTQGFADPIVVDINVAPGNGWHPSPGPGEGDRRLREYIDIATQGNRAYMVWTSAAPGTAAQLRVNYIDFD